MKFEWNVYRYNMNNHQIENFNALGGYSEAIERKLRECNSKDEFSLWLQHEMTYMYWSRAEYEVLIAPWCGDDKDEVKVDIYMQLEMNWDKLVDYCWAQCAHLGLSEKERVFCNCFGKEAIIYIKKDKYGRIFLEDYITQEETWMEGLGLSFKMIEKGTKRSIKELLEMEVGCND